MDKEYTHWRLPVGMHPNDVNARYGFVTGLQFVMQRSYLVCKLATILSRIKERNELEVHSAVMRKLAEHLLLGGELNERG